MKEASRSATDAWGAAGSAATSSGNAFIDSAEVPGAAHQRQHLAHRQGPMAVRVLGRRIELGDRPAERGDEDERVVAEAAAAARRFGDLRLPATGRDQRLG